MLYLDESSYWQGFQRLLQNVKILHSFENTDFRPLYPPAMSENFHLEIAPNSPFQSFLLYRLKDSSKYFVYVTLIPFRYRNHASFFMDFTFCLYKWYWQKFRQRLHGVGLRFRFGAKSRYELKYFAFT